MIPKQVAFSIFDGTTVFFEIPSPLQQGDSFHYRDFADSNGGAIRSNRRAGMKPCCFGSFGGPGKM